MRILVVGAGIAGLASALQLARAGHDVCVMERHPGPRTEGYMIDFFGPGFDAAERMGLLDALAAIHYPIERLLFVDRDGHADADLPYPRVRRLAFRNRHFNFLRGDLECVLREHLPAGVDLRFGTSPAQIASHRDGVEVVDDRGRAERYDLVVGADGVRSTVRELAFAGTGAHTLDLHARTAAWVFERPLPGVPRDAFVSYATTGLTAAVYPIRGDRTATFLVHAADTPAADHGARACRRELEATYRGRGWQLDAVLDAFPDHDDVYFDEILQVVAPQWYSGRVVLVGDACGCVSLLAGQGASMAMAGAWVLANELARADADPDTALRRYADRLQPAIQRRQRTGRRLASWFMPASDRAAHRRHRMMHWVVHSPLLPLFSRTIGATSIDLG